MNQAVSEIEERLAMCFKSVLPDLSLTDIRQANPDSVEGWDSVATVTLFAVIEEEFGINLSIDDVASDYSFQGILNCLKGKL